MQKALNELNKSPSELCLSNIDACIQSTPMLMVLVAEYGSGLIKDYLSTILPEFRGPTDTAHGNGLENSDIPNHTGGVQPIITSPVDTAHGGGLEHVNIPTDTGGNQIINSDIPNHTGTDIKPIDLPNYLISEENRESSVELAAKGTTNQQTASRLDFAPDVGFAGGALYPEHKLRQLVNYLERRNVSVFGTARNPGFMAYSSGGGQMLLPARPSVLQVKHELSHYLDVRNIGFEKYSQMTRFEREVSVLQRLQQNRSWNEFTAPEKQFSIDYVERLRLKEK